MKPDKENQAIILVVDDDINNLDILIEILDSSGFKSIVATDGFGAIGKAREIHPDLILLDVMMPGIDGFETCRRLKEDSSTKLIPVIFITALSELNNKTKGFEAGGVDYIIKPYENQEVILRINTHLAIHRLQEQLFKSEEKYRMMVETANEGIWLLDNEAHTILVNERLAGMLGYDLNEFVNRSVFDFIDTDSRELFSEHLSNKNHGMKLSFEFEFRHVNGSPIWVIVNATLLTDKKGSISGSMCMLTDITERKILEEEREKNIRELREALASVKQLKGLLPICMYCKKIRNDVGYWEQVEEYIHEHTGADFSHGLCDDCSRKYYPELFGDVEAKKG